MPEVSDCESVTTVEVSPGRMAHYICLHKNCLCVYAFIRFSHHSTVIYEFPGCLVNSSTLSLYAMTPRERERSQIALIDLFKLEIGTISNWW